MFEVLGGGLTSDPAYARGLMRPSLVLPWLALTACVADPPVAVLGGEGCEAIALTVLDPAVLPGWTVHAMVAERVDGDAVWTLATDPGGALMLKPWPAGPALDLSEFGEPDDFSLLPGRSEGESWLLSTRQAQLRVWRLGAASKGEVTASPDLSGYPGPGSWTYELMLIGEAPYLLAASTGVPAKSLRFQLAPLDAQDLTLAAPGEVLAFGDLCSPPAEDFCGLLTGTSLLAEVDVVAVTEPGAMAGAAALLGLTFPPDSMSPAFITLQANDRGAGRAPEVIGRVIGLAAAGAAPRVRGRIASDGRGLYSSLLVESADDPSARSFGFDYTSLANRESGVSFLFWDQAGPILQLGRAVAVTDPVDDRWDVVLVKNGEFTTTTASIELAGDTQLWSAGYEQWFARPSAGPAMRLGARCADASE